MDHDGGKSEQKQEWHPWDLGWDTPRIAKPHSQMHGTKDPFETTRGFAVFFSSLPSFAFTLYRKDYNGFVYHTMK